MSKRLQVTVAAAAIAVAIQSLPALAEDARLAPVVVSANRQEVPADQALASVTVLERADIEASQAPDLIDLLGRQAGIDIARSGGPGQSSTVFMRGGNSNHTLVLVDGIRVNAASQGIIDFAHIPLAQIDRIEIVRGPRAALWGSDAIGGIIHIFTRDPAEPFFEARLGSYQRAGASAGFGVRRGDSSAGVSVGGDRLAGFSATNADAFGHDPDIDGYTNRNLNLRAGTTLGNQRLSLTGLVTDADVDFDSGIPGEGNTAALNRVIGATLSGPLSTRWRHSLTLGHSSEDLDTPVYVSRFGSERDSLDWVNTVQAGAHSTFNVGINWARESAYSYEFGEGYENSRHNGAVFAAWRGVFAAHTLEASIRHDDNSQFDSADTGSVAWGWQASDSWRLRASWGQGFRAPNFNELFYPGFQVAPGVVLFAGNPALQPERSQTAELGMALDAGRGHSFDLSVYRTRVSDLIAFEADALFTAGNVRRAAIDGVELGYGFVRGGFTIDANATWLDARDVSDEPAQDLLRRAKRKMHASAGYRFDNQVQLAMDVSAFSQRPDFGGVVLPGYGRVDLRASAPLAAGVSLELRLENINGSDYHLVNGYNTPGRSGMLTLRFGQLLP